MAQQNVYGCPGQPSESILYARIDALPVLAQSSAYTASLGSSILTWDSGSGVTVSNSSGPTVAAQFNYTSSYNGPWRYPAFYAVDRQGGSLAGNDGADHHTIVVDSDTCTVWETYHAYVNTATGSIQTGNMCSGKACNAQSGWKYNDTGYDLPTQGTTDAAGLPLLPLLWRGHEILDLALNHPVRFTLGRVAIQAGHPQWPANGTNGLGGTNAPPYGARFRLKAAANISTAGLTPQQELYAATIVTALKRYGLVLADIGANLNAAVDDEAGQEPNVMAALNRIGSQIKSAQLEAVDLSSLRPSPASYLIAGSAPHFPSVRVGTPYPTFLNVQAGTRFQLQSWVNGPVTNKSVTWEEASGTVGTVTAGGLYTAPASVTGLVQAVLKVSAQADWTASSTVYLRIFPAGPIRIAAGLQSGTITDKLNQVWLPNLFFRGGNSVFHAGDSLPWLAPANPIQAAELNIYQTASYTYGNDQVMHLLVPNGTYNVRLMFGQPYNGQTRLACSPFPAIWHNFVGVEIQNAIVVKNYDFGASINHACGVPVDLNLTASVTDNILEVALRNTEPDGATHSTSPIFNGIEITRRR